MENITWRTAGLFLVLSVASFFGGSDADAQPTLRSIRLPSTQIRSSAGAPGLGACYLPAETGPCRAYAERYHFDITTGECEMFVYGGCQGNANNFETIQQCQAFGRRCAKGNQAPLPTRRPLSDHAPLDLKWVGKYPLRGGSGRNPGSGWSQ